jgi:carboxypeptidase Taq
MEFYEELKKMNADYYVLSHILEFLDHDRDAEMPSKASYFRGMQLGLLARLKNKIMKDEKWGKIFHECHKNKNLTNEEKLDVEETYRNWVHESGIPEELVRKLADNVANSNRIWTDVKHGKATFKDILPYLENIFEINKEIAKIKSKLLKLFPYDSLLDAYQPGLKVEKIDFIFNELKEFLPSLIQKYTENQKNKQLELNKEYSRDGKKKVCRKIAEIVGFDLERGRLSEVIHPHEAGYAPDVIVAVNYNKDPIDVYTQHCMNADTLFISKIFLIF